MRKPVVVSIGQPVTVELPPRLLRCRLTGLRFETNKTLLLPTAMKGIRELVRIYKDHAAVQVLVTGHADTVGSGSHNLGLSCERADAIAFFLGDKVDEWLAWYSGKPFSTAWGTREDQYMLSALVDPSSGSVYDDGPINGAQTAAFTHAAKRFQQANGVSPVNGMPGPKTRKALVTAYMALEGTSLPDTAATTTHGCGSHHLAVPTGDGVAEPANRRVELFLFEGAVDPGNYTLVASFKGADSKPATVAVLGIISFRALANPLAASPPQLFSRDGKTVVKDVSAKAGAVRMLPRLGNGFFGQVTPHGSMIVEWRIAGWKHARLKLVTGFTQDNSAAGRTTDDVVRRV